MRVMSGRHRLSARADMIRTARLHQFSAAVALTAVMALAASGAMVASAAQANEYIEDTDRFPGWKGELPQQQPLADDPATIGFGESGKVLCSVVAPVQRQTVIQLTQCGGHASRVIAATICWHD